MHLFKPLHHWHQKTGLGSLLPTSRLQILTRWFCTALIPALKFTAGTQHSPTNLSRFFSLLPAVLNPLAWHHELSRRRAALAQRMVGLLCPWLHLPAECSPTSSPNDVTSMRASHLNHNLWPCSQMLRGLLCGCIRGESFMS